MAHPEQGRGSVEVVEAAYEALRNRDLAAFLQLCHPEVVLTQDPALPWGGRYVGHDGATEFAITIVGTIDSAVTELALFRAGDTVVQYGRTAGTVRSSGAAFDIPECHLWKVVDGLVHEVSYFIDSDAMLDALGTGPG